MTGPARILILTSGSLSRNPRPAKEAAALAAAGHRVTVLRPPEGPPYDQLDVEFAAGAGFENRTVAAGATGAGKSFRRAARWIARRAVPLGFESVAALGEAGDLLAAARATPAELTIVHNEIALWAGRRLLRLGRRVAADIEDWYSEDLLPRDRRHRPIRLLQSLEAEMLQHAAYVSTTSAALSSALHRRYGGRRPEVITNSFPLQPAPRPQRPAGGGPVAFFWFSQTLGPGRGLEGFLPTWAALAGPSRLVLLGEPRPGFAEHLRSLVPSPFPPGVPRPGAAGPAAGRHRRP